MANLYNFAINLSLSLHEQFFNVPFDLQFKCLSAFSIPKELASILPSEDAQVLGSSNFETVPVLYGSTPRTRLTAE